MTICHSRSVERPSRSDSAASLIRRAEFCVAWYSADCTARVDTKRPRGPTYRPAFGFQANGCGSAIRIAVFLLRVEQLAKVRRRVAPPGVGGQLDVGWGHLGVGVRCRRERPPEALRG